ncbi:MAG: hypothetical protein WHS63_07230 [Tenuifilum sp.]|uniref:hypothetical protein n=1 Tax=Tenuifilum sp. TaxID=2760880 RepID=UPI003098C83D
MVEPEVQQRAADVLLDRGVRVKLPAPFWYRIVGVRHKSYILRRPKLGTLIAMSRIASGIDVDFDKLDEGNIQEAYRVVAEHGDRVAEFIAVALLNNRHAIERHAVSLARRIAWGISPDRLAEVFSLVVVLSGVQDFLSTIRFVSQTNVMRATILSQKESGS